jgi:Na+-transporting methylmalonyl-CoA/oxaloacetate decarboxylase gamma subunit
MGFSFDHISINNLFANGNNYITFSIMGMLIVFAGLSFISIYIMLLPKILDLHRVDRIISLIKAGKKEKKETDEGELTGTKDSELMLAIAVALHLDQTGGGSYEKITWKRHEDRESSWLTAGRARSLAVRSHLPDRRS